MGTAEFNRLVDIMIMLKIYIVIILIIKYVGSAKVYFTL